jgi:hypothetical protein
MTHPYLSKLNPPQRRAGGEKRSKIPRLSRRLHVKPARLRPPTTRPSAVEDELEARDERERKRAREVDEMLRKREERSGA